MFGREKPQKPRSSNPEIQKAMDDRDTMLAETTSAVENVDRLIEEYAEAEKP